jgi:hypothetical protein
MNYLKFFVCCFALLSCGSSNTAKDVSMFSALHKGRDIILVSCIRCDCMVEELSLIHSQRPEILAPYDIYIDSSCKTSLSQGIKTVHINQLAIDSLFTDIYNALIIKKRNDKFSIYMIETKDAQKMPNMLTD